MFTVFGMSKVAKLTYF